MVNRVKVGCLLKFVSIISILSIQKPPRKSLHGSLSCTKQYRTLFSKRGELASKKNHENVDVLRLTESWAEFFLFILNKTLKIVYSEGLEIVSCISEFYQLHRFWQSLLCMSFDLKTCKTLDLPVDCGE